MKEKGEIKDQLIKEVIEMRRKIADFGVIEIKHKRIEKELQKVRGELELQVKERTAELTAVNEKLQRDITERKQAEEKLEQSYQKLGKTMDNIISTIAKIVETRDPYTAGHQQRVSLLATAIAKDMGLSEDKVIRSKNSFINTRYW